MKQLDMVHTMAYFVLKANAAGHAYVDWTMETLERLHPVRNSLYRTELLAATTVDERSAEIHANLYVLQSLFHQGTTLGDGLNQGRSSLDKRNDDNPMEPWPLDNKAAQAKTRLEARSRRSKQDSSAAAAAAAAAAMAADTAGLSGADDVDEDEDVLSGDLAGPMQGMMLDMLEKDNVVAMKYDAEKDGKARHPP